MLNEHFNAGSATGYAIERSLRFNSADSAYLSKTFGSAGNRKTWTWAGWVKRSSLSTGNRHILVATPDGFTALYTRLLFTSNNIYVSHQGGTSFAWQSSSLHRDPSAWFHVVMAVDTPQATSSDRLKIYVNGTQIAASSATYPSINQDLYVNAVNPHEIGGGVGGEYFDGYLADIHFCDGNAYDPSYFTEFDDNGILQPKAFTGSYGTNGFHLDFADNSTAAALGTDSSGNGNTWTVNNISVTAGAGNDSLVDVPINGTEEDTGVGGQVSGNYCTLNPLNISLDASLSNGNLRSVSGGVGGVNGTIFVSSGKWYWETTLDASTGFATTGIGEVSSIYYPGYSANSYAYYTSGVKYNNDTSSSYGASWGVGDTIGVALDLDAGTLRFYKNGVSQGTAFSSLSGTFAPRVGNGASGTSVTWTLNAGARPFAYTAPSGFKALNTANLDPPTIEDPSTVMDVVTYTGDGAASGRNISTTTNPDLVWIKSRSISTGNHFLFDSVRGATKVLGSNQSIPEYTNNDFALGTGQFTVGDNGGSDDYNPNKNNATYVAWAWDAGSSTVTNNDGSITSSVRANPSAGFSIVTYTGTGSSSTVGHGLGIKPELLIVKNRTTDFDWAVYHSALGGTKYLDLNTTDAATTAQGRWNNTNPTTTVFSVANSNATNATSDNYVAYCFAPVAGYSAFGSYTGNGSADGPFVFLDFRARWIMFKRVAAADPWIMYDTARSPYNQLAVDLVANDSRAEGATSAVLDITSNGFKLRNSGTIFNQSGSQYIYCAFAESPFQYARAR